MARMVRFSRIVSIFKSHPDIGLIRWKLVIHASIDGLSRFVVGIQVDPQQPSGHGPQSVRSRSHQTWKPYHARRDHGVGNALATDHMEDIRSPVSYIRGR